MDVYAFLFYPIALALGLYLALHRKKIPEVRYTLLDKASIALNCILIPVYAVYSFMPMFLGMIIFPTSSANAWQCVVSILLSAVIAASPVYCAIALGMSVSYRRRGLSKKGFWVQFAGILGIIIPILIGAATDFISVPWMHTSLN